MLEWNRPTLEYFYVDIQVVADNVVLEGVELSHLQLLPPGRYLRQLAGSLIRLPLMHSMLLRVFSF